MVSGHSDQASEASSITTGMTPPESASPAEMTTPPPSLPAGPTLLEKARTAAGRRLLGGNRKSSLAAGSQGTNALHRLYNQTRIQLEHELRSPSLSSWKDKSKSSKSDIAPGSPAEKVFLLGKLIIQEHLKMLSLRNDFGKATSVGSSLVAGPCMEYLLRNDVLFQLVEISARPFDITDIQLHDAMHLTDQSDANDELHGTRLCPRLNHAPVLVTFRIAICDLIGRLIHRCGPHFLENAGIHRAMNLMIEVGRANFLDISEGRLYYCYNSPRLDLSTSRQERLTDAPDLHSRFSSAFVEMMFEVSYAVSQNPVLLPMLVRSEAAKDDATQVDIVDQFTIVCPLLAAQLQHITLPGRTGRLSRESIEHLMPFAIAGSPLGQLLVDENARLVDHALGFANMIGAASGALYSALPRKVSLTNGANVRDCSAEAEGSIPIVLDNDENYLHLQSEFLDMVTFTDRLMAYASAFNTRLALQLANAFQTSFVENILQPIFMESQSGSSSVAILCNLREIAETLPRAEYRINAWSVLWKYLLSTNCATSRPSAFRPMLLTADQDQSHRVMEQSAMPTDGFDEFIANCLRSSADESIAALDFLVSLLEHHPSTSRLLFRHTVCKGEDLVTTSRHEEDLERYSSLAQRLQKRMGLYPRPVLQRKNLSRAITELEDVCARLLESSGDDASLPERIRIGTADKVLNSLLQLTDNFWLLSTAMTVRVTSVWRLIMTNPLLELSGWTVIAALPYKLSTRHRKSGSGTFAASKTDTTTTPRNTRPSHSHQRLSSSQKFDVVALHTACHRLCGAMEEILDRSEIALHHLEQHAHGLLIDLRSLPLEWAPASSLVETAADLTSLSMAGDLAEMDHSSRKEMSSFESSSFASNLSNTVFSPFVRLFGRGEAASDLARRSDQMQDRVYSPVKLAQSPDTGKATKTPGAETGDFRIRISSASWQDHLEKVRKAEILVSRSPTHKQSLLSFLNNISILEEFIEEMLAIVQARRLTGIDPVTFLY